MTTDGLLTLDYAEEIIDVVDNGHSIEIEDGGQATIAGRGFELAQFHLHSRASDTVDGESSDRTAFCPQGTGWPLSSHRGLL